MSKITEGEWYKDRNIFIKIVKVLNDDWCDIHCMIIRDSLSVHGGQFLHEWTKQQYTPGGHWPDQSVQLLPDGPTQEILDALEWPPDPNNTPGDRSYRVAPKKSES